MVLELARAQVNGWRLRRHHLLVRAPKERLAEVVSDVCGLQAQVLSSAALALRARVRDLRMIDVEKALWRQRSLVKTWSMRGTLHLLAASDLPRNVAAMSWIATTLGREAFTHSGLSPQETAESTAAIRRALDGRVLTREELAAAVERLGTFDAATAKSLRSPWGERLQPAAFGGALCFGPNRGPKVTFARPDQWLGGWREVPGKEAFVTLLRRFIAAYGPITAQDAGHWWGFLGSRRQRALDLLEDELESVRFEGKRAWMRKADIAGMTRHPDTGCVRLLPSWDVYVMFYAPRPTLVPARFRRRIFTPVRGNRPVLLVDGVAAGVWEQRKHGNGLEIQVAPFRPVSASTKRRVEEEAADIGDFLGLSSRLTMRGL